MNIQLKSTKTVFLQLVPLNDDISEIFSSKNEISNESKFEFGLEVKFSESDKDEFAVVIHSELSRKDKFTLQAVFSAEFKAEGKESEFNKKFKESKFPYINAPAIAYPFFRAMIANTLVNCGLEPYYLPSVNFERLYREKIGNN